jgi:hypothetical protein
MNDVRLGDCGLVLKDETWDVLITDPPYREHVHVAATSCGTPGARHAKGMMGAAKRDLGFDHRSIDLRTWTCEAVARTRRWSVIFTDTESVGEWMVGIESAGGKYIRSIPWVRWSMPQLSGDRPPQGHEIIVLAYGSAKGKKSWNGPGNLTHFAQTCMRGNAKHKAQKPLDLMLELVEFFSDPSDRVCDPFSGSGSTALACKLLGRPFVGSELDPVWAEKAKARVTVEQYDDSVRYASYLDISKKRAVDMKRMADNTARIRANRERAEATADAAEMNHDRL